LFRRNAERWEFLWHYHREIELFVPLSTGEYVVGDQVGLLQRGEVYLLGAGLPHAFHGEGRLREGGVQDAWVLFFTFDGPWRNFVGSAPLLDKVLRRAGRGIRWQFESIAELEALLERMDSGEGPAASAAFFDCLAWLADQGSGETLCRPGLQRESLGTNSRLDGVCSYLSKRADDADLSLSEIVDATGWSTATLERMFKESFGFGVFRYVQELRIGRICRDLMETEQAVTTIALRRGFNTLSHFNRTFLREVGCTPSQYRKRLLYRSSDASAQRL